MNTIKMAAIVLLVLGILGLAYGGPVKHFV